MGVRYQQPQHGVQIDWTNPLLKKAVVWTPFGPTVLAGSKLAGTETQYDSAPVGKIGVGRKWKRMANAGVDFGASKIITGAECTILVVAAPANVAAIKVPFSQRVGSGSYQQIDFLFNATGDGLSAAAGNVELLNYDGGSRGITATSQTDGNPHCWVVSNSTTLGYLFRDGVKQALTQNVRSTSSQAAGAQKIRVGNIADDASTTYPHDDPLYLLIVWDRQLSEEEAEPLSANPWQVFSNIDNLALLFAQASGSLATAAAAGSATASGSAIPSTQVAISGIGVSTGAGVAQASIVFPLSAAGLVVSGGAGDASAAVSLDAFALARAAAQAGVSPAVLLAGAAAAEAAGNAALAVLLNELAAGAAQAGGSSNLTGSAPGEMSAAGKVVAAGQTALSITVRLQAAGNTHAGGGADGRAGSAGDLSALGQATAGGWSQQSALVNVTAAGFVKAMLQGRLDIDVPLVSQGINIASARAGLSVGGAVRSVRLEAGRPVVLTVLECTAVPALIIHHEAQHV